MATTWLNQGRFERFTEGPDVQPGGEPADPATSLAGITEEQWRDRVCAWKSRGGHWPWQQRTEPPDDPRTKVPVNILAEFDIVHEADPATPPNSPSTFLKSMTDDHHLAQAPQKWGKR